MRKFKAKFLHRFRDVRNDQYHFMQLQTAKQQKHETPPEFLDRCRSLAIVVNVKFEFGSFTDVEISYY